MPQLLVDKGLLEKPGPCHCEECGEVMLGVKHDEAISIYALPGNDNSEVLQQSLNGGTTKLQLASHRPVEAGSYEEQTLCKF